MEARLPFKILFIFKRECRCFKTNIPFIELSEYSCYYYYLVSVMFYFPYIVCNTVNPGSSYRDGVKPPIESLASLDLYEGCTEIDGNLIISIRGSGGSGLFALFVICLLGFPLKVDM